MLSFVSIIICTHTKFTSFFQVPKNFSVFLLLCMFFSIFSPHIPSLVLPIHNMSSFIFQLLLSTVVAARCCREHNIVFSVYSGLLHTRFCRCCRLSAASPSWYPWRWNDCKVTPFVFMSSLSSPRLLSLFLSPFHFMRIQFLNNNAQNPSTQFLHCASFQLKWKLRRVAAAASPSTSLIIISLGTAAKAVVVLCFFSLFHFPAYSSLLDNVAALHIYIYFYGRNNSASQSVVPGESDSNSRQKRSSTFALDFEITSHRSSVFLFSGLASRLGLWKFHSLFELCYESRIDDRPFSLSVVWQLESSSVSMITHTKWASVSGKHTTLSAKGGKCVCVCVWNIRKSSRYCQTVKCELELSYKVWKSCTRAFDGGMEWGKH